MIASPLCAQEAIDQEEPTPSSVDEVITPMERSFKERIPPFGVIPWIREQLKNTPPFFRDSKIDLNLRTYYRTRRNYDDSVNEAWALGGALSYRSGWFLERIGLGAVLYTSQPVYAPDNRDGTGLLKTGQEGYTVVGQAYARVRLLHSHFLNLYRYQYNTPYINSSDSRMTPKTFEGYTIQGTVGDPDGPVGLRYGAGYIAKLIFYTCKNNIM